MTQTSSAPRAIVSLAAAAVLAGGLTCLAAPAHAASSAGGAISRSEILTRAQSWVNEGVPYNQGAYYTDSNGTYREDCSGYVSMAWHLTSSLVTQTLPNVSTVIGFSQLQPGDALDYTADHTFLFAGWTNQSNGDFTYYAESNPNDPTHGPTPANIYDSTLEGWPTSDYEGLRYNNVAPDYLAASAPTAVTTSNGTIALYAVRSDGNVWGQSQDSVGGSFGGWQQLTPGGGFVGKPAVVIASNGAISIYARGSNGSVWQGTQAQPYGAFTWTSLGGTSVAGDPSAVVLPNGAQAVFATATDGYVWEQNQSAQGGSFGGWHQVTPGNGFVGKPSAIVTQSGAVDVYARGANGSVWQGTQATQSGSFTWTSLGGTSVSGDPTALVRPNGKISVYATATDGNVWGQDQATVGGSFGGWQQLSTGGGDTGEPAAIMAPDGSVGVYVTTSAGSVNGGTQQSNGTFSWASLGGTSVTGDVSAIAATSSTIALYIAATDGHVWGQSQNTLDGPFSGWQ